MKSEILPYEKEAQNLLNLLKNFSNDEMELGHILSCVIDRKEDILELTEFIEQGEDVNIESITDYAYYLCKD